MWPPGFARIPGDAWTRAPIEGLARKYDRVEEHGWYANLDPTVEELDAVLRAGATLVDYSGGTGILIGRLLDRVGARDVHVVNVDASPKFLRLSLEKFRDEPRVAFRHLRWLPDAKRLERVDEVLGPLVGRVDALVSANAIHLYTDLDGTLAAWRRVLRPTGRVLVQSGNVRSAHLRPGQWLIDGTVHAAHAEALRLAREDARFARFRADAEDAARQARYDQFRRKVFPEVRDLATYAEAFERAGFRLVDVAVRPVEAGTREWLQFLSVYHEAILGWAGGVEKVEGAPVPDATADRLALLAAAFQRLFPRQDAFQAAWTYATLVPAST